VSFARRRVVDIRTGTGKTPVPLPPKKITWPLATLAGAILLAVLGLALLRSPAGRYVAPVVGKAKRVVVHAVRDWRATRREPMSVRPSGVRDIQRSLARPPGVRRVLVLGGSLVAGPKLPLQDLLTRKLENLLLGAREPVEVISLASAGADLAELLARLDSPGFAYDPADVLYLPGEDDVGGATASLDALHGACEARGIRVWIALVPETDTGRALLDRCERLGVRTVDLRPVLQQASAGGMEVWAPDGSLTREGHTIVAGELAARLRAGARSPSSGETR
jgi:hypothetical protein